MLQSRIRRFLATAVLTGFALLCQAQVPPPAPMPPVVPVDQPDAQRTREWLSQLLQRYPPELRGVLSLDPSLLGNRSYLGPYPALVSFLDQHPEILRNPSFYLNGQFPRAGDRDSQAVDAWRDDVQGLEFLIGFGFAMLLIGWLIRNLMDYRRWNRQSKVQTDVHTKLLDRLTGNEELIAYIQSPAGSKFLESSPITLDSGPRNVGAPLGRILWTVQAGVVLMAAGIGLLMVSVKATDDAARVLNGLGVFGIAVGAGFVISAIISFIISRHLGLVETAPRPQAQG